MRRKRKYRLIGLIYRLLFVRAGRDGPFFPFIYFFFLYLSFYIIFIFNVPSATGQRHSLWSLPAANATTYASYYRAKAPEKQHT